MEGRIGHICSVLPPCRVFADVGCDHGYMARHVLRSGLCERAYISDVSAGSLEKAKTLLRAEIEAGRCIPVVADGMKGLPEDVDLLLIAGMGGEEIVKILEEGYLPEKFVFQPMKNSEKVRAYLAERGCRITADYTFGEGYFYDLIIGERTGGEPYTEWEIAFGRDNLRSLPPAFIGKIRKEREKLRAYLGRPRMQKKSRDEVLGRLYRLEVVTNAIEDME